ncbi:hypothetical protein L204_100195 [Cryptococcus depauperatus]
MQRKALKQLGKVTQWTSEKVFSGEKTQLSQEFLDFEQEIEIRGYGIERLHATSLPFFQQLIKAKASADPYPPAGAGKDKVTYTEALGLVMIDYGEEIGDDYGDALSKYGRARCKLASAQEEFASRLGDGYVAGMESALAAVNEYKTLRKKLDSRRLALDATISRTQNSKKDTTILEEEINLAKQRFEEVEEEVHARMINIQEAEAQQYTLLVDLLEAEVDYHAKCQGILDDLRNAWGSHSSRPRANTQTRSRSNTVTSTRSLSRALMTRSHTSRHNAVASSEEESTTGRSRSQSNASSSGKSKEKKSMLPSFGSLGRKSGLSNIATSKKDKKKDKFSESRTALHSDEEQEEFDSVSYSKPQIQEVSQSHFASSSTSFNNTYDPAPRLRRALTSPPVPARHVNPNTHYVKALYDYQPNSEEELGLRVGMVVRVEKEINDDWWIGESETNGKTGMFPKTYTEEYVPPLVMAVPPPMPGRRDLPPPVVHTTTVANIPPSPNLSFNSDFESEAEHSFSDADHQFTAPLAVSPQPAAIRSVSGKKAPPPPPPSRRAVSSNNILDLSQNINGTYLSPPKAPFGGRTRSGTAGTINSPGDKASPFTGSDDDEADGVEGRSRGRY